MRMEIFFFFFRFDLAFLPPFSVFFLPFLLLFLCIPYAGPFVPRLIGIEEAALRRYNGKPNIFGLKFSEQFSFVFPNYM